MGCRKRKTLSLIHISYPVGKVNVINIFPMNFEEFLVAKGEEEACKLLMSGAVSYTHLNLHTYHRRTVPIQLSAFDHHHIHHDPLIRKILTQ